MPELPEVETTCRGIEPHIINSNIVDVVVRQPKLRWPVPDDLSSHLLGHSVRRCYRRAKYLLLAFEAGTLVIHLGMSGSLRIICGDIAPSKHDHVDIVFANGSVLRYHDPRRFGAVLWLEGGLNEHKLFADLGPEPLDEDFCAEYIFQRSRGRKIPIKSFIMDSHVVVGVGNIYANEALFIAGIRPQTLAGKVSKARYTQLCAAIKAVLAKAIKQGGTTLKDFVGGDGKPGYFQQQLRVYGRAGRPCVQCDAVLKEIKIAGRSTVYCPRCQR